jgi:hypothetical protein
MAFDLRAQRRNVYAATALSAQTVTSQTETMTVGQGVRFYVYGSATTQGSGTDSIALVAVPPDGNANIVLGTFSGTHLLSATAGARLVFDFRPGETGSEVGSGITFAAGTSYGAMAISPPRQWAVQITLGTGNSATVAIDAEILP